MEQHEEPGAKPQSGQEGDKPGSLPEKLPDQLPPLDQLRDQLKKLADKPREAAKDRQDAQKLREQAQKLWENATPEQRKQIEQMARELAKSRQPGANDEAGRGPQGPGKRPDRPDEPATGSGERELGGKGEGPGDGAPGVKTAARASDDPGKPHDIDARSSGDEQAPSRIIAEWLTNKPGPSKPGEPTAPQQVTDAVKQQQQAAEQALQQRTVPGRLGPLVRRYFDRLPGAVGAQPSNAEPKSQPAPKPAGQ